MWCVVFYDGCNLKTAAVKAMAVIFLENLSSKGHSIGRIKSSSSAFPGRMK